MTEKEYLEAVLKSQTIPGGSDELKALQDQRETVEGVLRSDFGSSPTIRYGGSKAKHTMIRESYDLDILCYFPREDDDCGTTLREIYDSVCETLSGSYSVERKASALRLMKLQDTEDYTHIDVVPGRFTDESKEDVFLHQEHSEGERLKTNPDVQITHVRSSGVRDAIKLMKLWNTRKGLRVKTFVLELLVIDLLKKKTSVCLPDQLRHVLTQIRDSYGDLTVEDPANPSGNDLSDLLDESVQARLRATASTSLLRLEESGWEAIFGELGDDRGVLLEGLKRIAVAGSSQPKPWYNGR